MCPYSVTNREYGNVERSAGVSSEITIDKPHVTMRLFINIRGQQPYASSRVKRTFKVACGTA